MYEEHASYLGEVREGGVIIQDVRQMKLWACQHVNLMFAVVDALLKTREIPTDMHVNVIQTRACLLYTSDAADE